MAIAVLTSAAYDITILPAFVQHYANQGAEIVYVSVLELVPGLMEATREVSKALPIPVVVHEASERWRISRLEAQNKTELRAKVGLRSGDWYVPADLDEFIDFDRPLKKLVADLQGCSYAMGTYVDRLSEDGSLAPYDPARPIEEQFPVKSRVTRDVMWVDDRKVVICRGDRAVSSGHHRVIDQSVKMWPVDYRINHYAWKGGRKEALQRRVANYKRHGIPVFKPVQRLFEHWGTNGGRFNLKELDLV